MRTRMPFFPPAFSERYDPAIFFISEAQNSSYGTSFNAQEYSTEIS